MRMMAPFGPMELGDLKILQLPAGGRSSILFEAGLLDSSRHQIADGAITDCYHCRDRRDPAIWVEVYQEWPSREQSEAVPTRRFGRIRALWPH